MTHINLVRGVRVELEEGDLFTVETEAHSSWSKGWVAKVTAVDESKPGGLERRFLTPYRDTTNRKGNGHKQYVLPEPGIYEADSVYRSFTNHRTYFRITEGLKVELIGSTSEGPTSKSLRNDVKAEMEVK